MSMMHEITDGLAQKRHKRVGRGEGSKGKTSGRGNKGAGARAGGPHWKPAYEGGQTALFRRLPKRGFSNYAFAKHFNLVNLCDIETAFEAGAVIDADMLEDAGLISDQKLPIKILANGELTKKVTIKANWYSKSALTKMAALGGECLNVEGAKFELPKPKKKFVKRDPEKKEAPVAAKPETASE